MTVQLTRLDHYRLLAVEGPDSRKFLQGQVTCDVRELSLSLSRPGAHCTHKGRMVFAFLALARNEQDLLLRTHASTLEAARRSLGKYIVFSKATLREATEWTGIGVMGEGAAAWISQHFGQAPHPRWACHWQADGAAVCITPASRYECWIPAARAETLLATADVVPSATWTACDIADGLGDVRGETVETFLPQQINLQLTDGISFTKGCYTGQEIVARTHYRGALKNAMFRLGIRGDVPAPGTPVHQHERHIGDIVMAAPAAHGAEALAVLTLDAADAGGLSVQGGSAQVLPLPYSLPDNPAG